MAWLTGYMDPKQVAYLPATLTRTDRPKFFGATALKNGEMAKFVKDNLKDLKKEVGEKEFRNDARRLGRRGNSQARR